MNKRSVRMSSVVSGGGGGGGRKLHGEVGYVAGGTRKAKRDPDEDDSHKKGSKLAKLDPYSVCEICPVCDSYISTNHTSEVKVALERKKSILLEFSIIDRSPNTVFTGNNDTSISSLTDNH
jgi:hypothetical protein